MIARAVSVVVLVSTIALTACAGATTVDGVAGMRLDRLDGPGSTTIADFAGDPLVVNLFASWCAPCVREMPAFESVHRSLRGRVGFLGVAVRDSEAAARALVRRTGVSYPVTIDRSDRMLAEVRAVGMPVTLFVRDDGSIARVRSGELDEDLLRSLLDEVLGVRSG